MSTKRSIKFNEELHRYTDEDNNVYTSVTTLIGKYCPKFDEDFWAKKKSLETGLSVSQIKANWKDIRDAACERGTREHKMLEDSINGYNNNADFKFDDIKKSCFKNLSLQAINKSNIYILANSPLTEKYPDIYRFLKEYIDKGFTLYAEKRVYWYPNLIAGTIDCLLVKDKQFYIVDWKTNKEPLKFKSGYYRKVNGIKTNDWVDKKEYLLKPLQYLEHCKGIVYTMQLSIYAYILELWGFKCMGLILFHMMPNSPLIAHNLIYDKSSCEILFIAAKNASSHSSSISNTMKFGLF